MLLEMIPQGDVLEAVPVGGDSCESRALCAEHTAEHGAEVVEHVLWVIPLCNAWLFLRGQWSLPGCGRRNIPFSKDAVLVPFHTCRWNISIYGGIAV